MKRTADEIKDDIKNEQIAQRIRYADIREGKRRLTELHKELEGADE